MGGVFYGCCGTKEDEEVRAEQDATTNQIRNSIRTKDKKNKKQDKFDDIENNECGSETPRMDPKINMMAPKTLKLLTDIGELKTYEENTIGQAQMKENLRKHADILARLENPQAFQ